MQAMLIVARSLHFAATIALFGVFAWEGLVAGEAAAASARLQRRLQWLAWASLALAVASGAAWLAAVAVEMSGAPIAEVVANGALGTVVTRTRFGGDWMLRFGLASLVALSLIGQQRWRALRWAGLILGTGMLATLAWAGHGGATPAAAGNVHLAADILHLLASGVWLGMLAPFALLLAEARRQRSPDWTVLARIATRRYSRLAIASVAVLLATGLVNTWFLAGTVPALVGTFYGQLLLAKIALFAVLLGIGAVNLRRLAPRLTQFGGAPAHALLWLRRNALSETAIGLVILAIVGALGALPPGAHDEPNWPFPFRIEIAELRLGDELALAIIGLAAAICAINGVAAATAGGYRRAVSLAGGLVLCLAAGWLPLRGSIEPAYPTSFAIPAEPYAVSSIIRGGALYAENCATCHGTSGRGDGPAAAAMRVRPADLTEAHLFAHTPGDLFWWVGHGGDDGAMPGFAEIMTAGQRWDVINFVRARAAGVMARRIGPEIAAAAASQIPDFALTVAGAQQTLGEILKTGPVLLIAFEPPAPRARLATLAQWQPVLARAGLRLVAVNLGSPEPRSGLPLPLSVVDVSAGVTSVLALFPVSDAGGETELLLDRRGVVRARWTADNLADAATLAADAELVSRAAGPPVHVGHAH